MVEILGKQCFHYDFKELFEPITKRTKDSRQKIHEESKSATKANEALDESNDHVKGLELLNKNWVIHSTLIRPRAKVLVPSNKSHFWFRDDPDSDNWNDFEMNVEKVTKYDDEIVFKNSGKIFTLRGDVLKMLTDYKFNTSNWPNAKLIIDYRDE